MLNHLQRLERIFLAVVLSVVLMLVSVAWMTSRASAAEMVPIETAQYRWGDSPRLPDGTLQWLQSPGSDSEWSELTFPGKPVGRNNNRHLWLRIPLPATSFRDSAIYFQAIDQVFEAYLDGKMIYHFGHLDANGNGEFSGNPFHIVTLGGDTAGKKLMMRVFSSHANIGVFGKPRIGERADLISQAIFGAIDRSIAGVLCVFIGIFVLVIFLLRRTDIGFLAMGLFALDVGIYMVARTKITDLIWGHELLRSYVEHLTMYLQPAIYCLYLEAIFGAWHFKIMRRFWQLILVYALLALTLSLVGVVPLTATLAPFWGLTVIVLIAIVSCAISFALKGDIDAKIFLVGTAALAFTVFLDVAIATRLVRWSVSLQHWGVFVMILCSVGILGRRFAAVYQRIGRLKAQLEKILAGTKKMASAREKTEAVAQATEYVLAELSLLPNPNVVLTLSTQVHRFNEGPRKELHSGKLFDAGKPCSSPKFEVVDEQDPAMAGVIAAMSRVESFVDAEGKLHIPLVWGEERIGCLSLDKYALPKLDEEEAHFADTLASSLALALENIDFIAETADKAKLDAEIHAAEVVQQTLLPQPINLPNLKISTLYRAATKVGGDWYGYHHDEKNNRIYCFIGDVTGHGIPSALLAGVVCGSLYGGEKRADLYTDVDVSISKRLQDMASTVNAIVFDTGRLADRLMTMLFLGLDLNTGEVHYLNAGHNSAYHLHRETGRAQVLVGTGNRLGYNTPLGYDMKAAKLSPGDGIFLYTDGLIENAGPDGKVFSLRDLKTLLSNNSDYDTLHEQILKQADVIWKNVPPNDDVTMLSIVWLGPNSGTQPPPVE